MMEESYVSFDTAKLLKEAGFDAPCRTFYTRRGEIWIDPEPYDQNECKFYYSRPTQALAARWLCERKMIEVSVAFCRRRKSWYYWVGYLDCQDEDVIFGFDYASRQYAMEAGLQEALNVLKNKDYEEDNVLR